MNVTAKGTFASILNLNKKDKINDFTYSDKNIRNSRKDDNEMAREAMLKMQMTANGKDANKNSPQYEIQQIYKHQDNKLK